MWWHSLIIYGHLPFSYTMYPAIISASFSNSFSIIIFVSCISFAPFPSILFTILFSLFFRVVFFSSFKCFPDAPIFIYIHGGYWQELDKTVSAYVVEPLHNAGHKVIVLDYDLCPNISLEQLADQIQRAGIWIVNYAMSMGTRYFFVGCCCSQSVRD